MVSIITPFFETPPDIFDETIRSVRDQTHTAWELILCNDGSRGACVGVALRHASADPDRIRLVAHEGGENRGHSATRNLGLHHARGDHVLFLDSDDVLLPNKLREQVAMLESFPDAGMIYGRSLYWYSWMDDAPAARRDWVPRMGIAANTPIDPPAALPLLLSGRAAMPPPCAILARREAVLRVGGFEEEFRRLYEDQVFIVKLCMTTPIIAADAVWDLYRQRPDSLSASAGVEEDREARMRFLEWVIDYVAGSGVIHPAVVRACRREVLKLRHPRIARFIRVGARLVRRVRGGRPPGEPLSVVEVSGL